MALIIEDGTNVAGANSFVTDAEFVDYAAARGLTIPVDATEREQLLILSIDYLFSREGEMQGVRTFDDQSLMYPRQCVYIRGNLLDENTIPNELKNAQMESAIASSTQPLLINANAGNVKKEKLDTLEVEYYSGGSFVEIRTDRIDVYLDVLLRAGANSTTLVRI